MVAEVERPLSDGLVRKTSNHKIKENIYPSTYIQTKAPKTKAEIQSVFKFYFLGEEYENCATNYN